MPKQLIKDTFDTETVELIKKTVAPDANPHELALFIYQAKKTGLNPLARQIYCVKIGGKVTIQASIDGLRLVAQRTGEYAGQDEPEFIEEGADHPSIAKVTVYKFSKSGNRYAAATGVAYWSEYCPPTGRDFMWKKMPHTMLSKVAEALALRKAFPQELSGIYSAEEMSQAQEVSQKGTVEPIEDISEQPEDNTVSIEEAEEILDSIDVPDSRDSRKCNECGTVGRFHKPGCSHDYAAT